MFNQKKGIQLSVNFLVIIIIAMVVFGIGLNLTYKLMFKAEEMRENVDKETQREIEQVLTSGEMVAIPLNHKKSKIASSVQFGLGIFNIENTQKFEINMNFEKAYGKNKQEISVNGDEWILTYFGPYEIDKNDQKMLNLPVRIPRRIDSGITPVGTYIFKVEVQKEDGSRYGNTQKVYVEVQ